ncbi:sporulation transcriptional regulator SpoIIID [Bacillus paranthracis]|uniref:sporulation transcriptional regulator SpoIIID n=1 Tax=Bacillus paranthracis TaxID=2026186 RepID=UPI0022DF1E7D|nr:sporulation transcriptional regulator SpoIIID [Bacillus paranthracis]
MKSLPKIHKLPKSHAKSTISLAIKAMNLILEEDLTLVQTGKRIGRTKSTVHLYIHQIIKYVHPDEYKQIVSKFESHQVDKHIRGGETTKKKYEDIRANIEKNILW